MANEENNEFRLTADYVIELPEGTPVGIVTALSDSLAAMIIERVETFNGISGGTLKLVPCKGEDDG